MKKYPKKSLKLKAERSTVLKYETDFRSPVTS